MIKIKPIRLSSNDFIDMLYKSILRRESDLAGREFHACALEKSDHSQEAIASTIESFINSEEARDTLFTRDALRLLKTVPDFDDVISLGDHCLTSYLLKIYSLKKWSSPFDWLFSNPSMISHCLKDNFETFLNPSFYKEANSRDDDSTDGRTIHNYYAEHYNIRYVFNHHDLTQPTQYSYMKRCVERFCENAKNDNKKLYLLIYDENSHPENDLNQLAIDLNMFSSNHKFAAIRIIKNTTNTPFVSQEIEQKIPNFYHINYCTKEKLGPLRLTDVHEETSLFKLLKSIN